MATSPAAPIRVLVREAAAADLPRLLELYRQLAELSTLPGDAAGQVTEAHRAMLTALESDPRATCLALEVEGQVAGTLTLYVLPNLSHGARPFAIVENVIVEAGMQGRGYGRLLMDRAEALARARGCYKVALLSNNKRADAHRFYEGIGYAPSHQGFTKYQG